MSDKDYTVTKVKAYGLGVYILWFLTLLTALDAIKMIGRIMK